MLSATRSQWALHSARESAYAAAMSALKVCEARVIACSRCQCMPVRCMSMSLESTSKTSRPPFDQEHLLYAELRFDTCTKKRLLLSRRFRRHGVGSAGQSSSSHQPRTARGQRQTQTAERLVSLVQVYYIIRLYEHLISNKPHQPQHTRTNIINTKPTFVTSRILSQRCRQRSLSRLPALVSTSGRRLYKPPFSSQCSKHKSLHAHRAFTCGVAWKLGSLRVHLPLCDRFAVFESSRSSLSSFIPTLSLMRDNFLIEKGNRRSVVGQLLRATSGHDSKEHHDASPNIGHRWTGLLPDVSVLAWISTSSPGLDSRGRVANAQLRSWG